MPFTVSPTVDLSLMNRVQCTMLNPTIPEKVNIFFDPRNNGWYWCFNTTTTLVHGPFKIRALAEKDVAQYIHDTR
jgi:hypothetical protein